MSLKKYSFLKTSCPELFKLNSQEDYIYIYPPFLQLALQFGKPHKNDGLVTVWNHQFLESIQGMFIEGSLEVKLPTIWRDEKAVSREKSQKRKDQKKEDAGARRGRKVAKHCVFSWFCGSGGLKSRLAKAAGAETSGEMRDEKLHAVVARSRFRSEKVQRRTTFGSWDVEKVHGVVARSRFGWFGSKMC